MEASLNSSPKCIETLMSSKGATNNSSIDSQDKHKQESTYEEVLERHRRERKDMLTTTQKMKHAVPKNDKKRKKEALIEIADIMSKLDLKHEEELKRFEVKEESCNGSSEEIPSVEMPSLQNGDSSNQNSQPRISKAQKRRSKKVDAAKKRQEAINEQEVINLTGNRQLEMNEITQKLSERCLKLHEIPSDGNCLYNAISHQLALLKLEQKPVDVLRKLTSEYLLAHRDEFIPFMTNPVSDEDLMTEDQYTQYCENIASSNVWGGQVEIQALTHVCGKPIEVIQAGGPSIVTGDEANQPRIIISYHKHVYGLGAHYNSVEPT